MKKLMLLCVAMAYCTCSFAQMWDNSKPDKIVTFGVRAGLNMSKLNGVETKRVESYHVGVNVDYNINKSFALETGVLFTEKGFKVDFNSRETFHRHFFLIPVLARFKFYVSEDFNIQLRAGGFGALRVGSNADQFMYLEYNNFDAGLIGGLGISYKSIYLGAQYEYGLTEITRIYAGHTSNIAISLGYDF